MNKVLAVIPARGGSKGLPRKNLLPFCGKPLLAWSVEAALSASCVSACVVSSEDEETLAVALEYGATPMPRPEELSRDDTTSAEVVDHVLNELSQAGESFNTVLLLQPTSPLRTARDIDAAFEMFLKHNLPCCVSVNRLKQDPPLAYTSDNGVLTQAMPGAFPPIRQQRPAFWGLNGAIYFVDAAWFRQHKKFVETGLTCGYEMPFERSPDIDTRLDFDLAEFLANYQNKL